MQNPIRKSGNSFSVFICKKVFYQHQDGVIFDSYKVEKIVISIF